MAPPCIRRIWSYRILTTHPTNGSRMFNYGRACFGVVLLFTASLMFFMRGDFESLNQPKKYKL